MNPTRLIAAAAFALLSACNKDAPVAPAADPVAPGPGITLYFSAAPGLNPGAGGTPAPVRVRLYELRNSAAFARADYFALTEGAQAALSGDLLDQDEVLLHPGEQFRLARTLDPATRQLGLVVGYREIDQAQWRSVLPVPPRDYQISLDVRAVRSAVAAPQTDPAR